MNAASSAHFRGNIFLSAVQFQLNILELFYIFYLNDF